LRFWDTSALVPLLFKEESTPTLLSLLPEDPSIVVSFLTLIELTSAISRRAGEKRAAQRIADALETGWTVIDDHDVVLSSARRLAAKHGLRSGDAIQLASALASCRGASDALPFVVLDKELISAARAEGFPVLP